MAPKVALALFGVWLASAPLAHAGDVVLSQHGRTLKLTSVADFQVTLSSVPSGGGDPVMGNVSVTPGLGTTLNGNMEAVKLTGVESVSVSAQGGDGQSEVSFDGLSIAKKLSFKGGDGMALIGLDDSVIGGDVSIHAGRGILNLEGGSNQISGKLDVKGGPSPDDVTLVSSVGRNVVISLGEGSNESSFSGAVGRSITIKGGTFTDVVSLGGVVSSGALKVDLGSGSNHAELGAAVIHGKVSYKGKSDDDSLLFDGSILQNDVSIDFGSGDNDATFNNTVFDADLSVKAGSGADTVSLTGSTSVAGKQSFKLGAGQ